MGLEPDEIEGLLGAYALDAVDDDERRAIEEYLATNPRARAEVQQHREVATMLAFTGSTAPEGLWDRIAAVLDDQAPAPGPELAKVLPHRRSRRTGWLVAGGVAAAAAVIVGVLTFGFVQRGNQLDRARQEAAAAADLQRNFARAAADPQARLVDLRSPDGGLSVRAVVEPSGTGFLAAQALPSLAEDRTYQLWGVVPDSTSPTAASKVISLGVLGNRPAIEAFSAPAGVTALAITDEVEGGVPVSSQPPSLQGPVV